MRAARLLLPALAALLAAAACQRAPAAPGRVTGRVVRAGRGVPMALVQAYGKPEQDRSTAPVAEAPSGEDGSFDLPLPPGRHWIWAKATVTEGGREVRLVGKAGAGPVEPPAGGVASVTIELEDPSGFSASAGAEGTGVAGRVSGAASGQAVTVYAYRGRSERPVGPGFVAALEAGADGRFRMNLEPGEYTLAARVRKSGVDYGPPEAGDRVASRVAEVRASRYEDVGELKLAPLDPVLRGKVVATLGEAGTRVEGVVKDAAGRPAEGVRILAFRDGRMAGKPAALSPATGPDGVFSLRLPEGGRWFLGARSRIGGPASPGEKVGQFRGEDGAGALVAKGQVLAGVEIVVEEVW